MATMTDKVGALRATVSLKERLVQIEVPPLCKEWVERAMKTSALGLSPDAWRWRAALRERQNYTKEQWKVFTLKAYLRLHDAARNGLTPAYGAPMPSALLERIWRVERHLPYVQIEVHALKSDDPYVFVVDEVRDSSGFVIDGGREAIGAWYGRNFYQKVFLGS